ncbi:ABC-2 type transporter-domain-containing protein [Cladorrhinum sp. PSN332]|nr:ABC-2 type transporter-domain-containing protein [Cladorrhinum sp. PSN332]
MGSNCCQNETTRHPMQEIGPSLHGDVWAGGRDKTPNRSDGSRVVLNDEHAPDPKLSQDHLISKLRMMNPAVDPSTPAFDFDLWSRTIASLRAQLDVTVPPRSGFSFQNLTVRGGGSTIAYQDTVWTWFTSLFDLRRRLQKKERKTILHGLDGVLHKGELLLVLGLPGSGCTTFLKTITGQTHGLDLDPESVLEYRGISHDVMTSRFKGELVYAQEADQHFPYLTVEQTLEFAAAMRTPRTRLPGVTRTDRINHVVEVMLAVFGLSQSRGTIVGDDYVRGVSGGERKRVSIAETALAEVAVSAWDNATRGLDAGSALSFIHRLRTLSDFTGSCTAAALYQSSQAMFDQFDKVLVLYQGREIFFGPAASASPYFEQMGWCRRPRQTTGDFLTAVTNPSEREVRQGVEGHIPETPEEFEKYWRDSDIYAALQAEMHRYRQGTSSGADTARRELDEARAKVKERFMLSGAPQMVSFPRQTKICAERAYRQLLNDKASTFTALGGEVIIALVVGSMFHGSPDTTDALFSRGSVLFFSVLLNILVAMTDMHSVYGRREVIQKQVSCALYRPSAEALASVLVDFPVKLCIATCFNIILYFLAGLDATAGQFFTFFLFVFVTTLAMSMVFRTIAAATRTLAQAMAVAGLLILALITYTGFVLPGPYMPPWFKWISYLNPLAYAFEALLVNEVHGSNYPCADLVPSYSNMEGNTFICPVAGAVAGQTYVSGDAWFELVYGYSYSHLWRNLGIVLGFLFFFLFAYMLATELNARSFPAFNALVFRRGRGPDGIALKGKRRADDVESRTAASTIASSPLMGAKNSKTPVSASQDETFSWQNVCLDIKTKQGSRRLLDNVSGWVRPGTLTALMGVSGAGKTTLLDTLAQRISSGSIKGEFLMGGRPILASFNTDVAYVQQQDVHLETCTVREALRFSATLRQDVCVPKGEKLTYVEDIIGRLGMEDFAEAVVGVHGKGLNLEQRKRLSIGVELAANPSAILFLDEPTSGLDSQSSETIVALLRKLATGGLSILCTIHQPSAMLFQQFDRLVLMARGGRTTYFGDIGENAETVLGYFNRHGSRPCPDAENPAEYLLDVIGATDAANPDWPRLWGESSEAKDVSDELERVGKAAQAHRRQVGDDGARTGRRGAYTVPLLAQFPVVFLRVFQQYWRSPGYILSKFILGIGCSLFIGFSFFQSGLSILDVQNAIFSVLMICATFNTLAQQVMPNFLLQRAVYEVRERHSNMYSWVVLILANILTEITYHIVLGVVSFAIYNYAVFGIRSAADQGLVLLFFVQFYILAGTFAQMVIAPLPNATTAGRVTTILFAMMVLFAGVFQTPAALPDFWIFMYRVSPMTYMVGGISVSGLAGKPVVCSPEEVAVFQPPSGESCASYLEPYLANGGSGKLLNPDAAANCSYCPLQSTTQALGRFGMYYNDRWFDWAIGLVYIGFNIGCVFLLYYLFRIRIWGRWMRKLVQMKREKNAVRA